MRLLIISDLHLTHRNYDEEKCNYIIKLIEGFDQVIINGDLWCAFTSTFDQFLNSKWSKLFDVLASHNCVYIEGNHDLFELSDERVNMFCTFKCKSYSLAVGGRNIVITHGNKLAYDWNKSNFEVFLRRLTNAEALPIMFEDMLIKLFGFKVFIKLYKLLGNSKQKNSIKKLNFNSLIIVGHTHSFEDDRTNGYINTGRIGNVYSSFVTIIDDEISLNVETVH